jgi:probable F420-dependent oxidoreductase
MHVGLHALGIGTGSDPSVIHAVARTADGAGFATLWVGEHVIMVDRPDAPYPYADDGRIAVPSDADWLDPLAVLAFAAACTSRIRLATGVLLLPEHHPVVVAKQAASLDVLSRGRFTLGIGIGWSSEEFAALGIPYASRARRTAEYVAALRTLWQDDPSSFAGAFVQFDAVRCFPKPVAGRSIPVVLGGNSDHALDRVVSFGDGWYGFSLTRGQVPERMAALRERCTAAGRDPQTLRIAVAVQGSGPEVLPELEALGIDEAVVVASPPADPVEAADWVLRLATAWRVVPERSARE